MIDAERLKQSLLEIAAFGRLPEGGVSRLGFSPPDQQAREWVIREMRDAGLDVWVDAAANVHGRRQGKEPTLPAILFGSHVDSVPEGGIFDGTLGSLGALEVLRSLDEHGIETRHPLEMVIWADEEGVTFGQGLFGSRAATAGPKRGELDLVDAGGESLSEWLERYGQNPGELDSAVIDPKDVAAYFELHIEQGPHLHRQNVPIGVVSGIVGIFRFDATIEGFANHAGTTPMEERRDAMLSAAKLTQAVREEVMARPGRQVGNVGLLRAFPGAPNVVPGRVNLPIELRDLDEAVVTDVLERIRQRATAIARDDRTTIRIQPFASEGPALTDVSLQDHIARVSSSLGLDTVRLPSGAGHDAQSVARHGIPTGMIFVRSKDGVSHNPNEWTDWEDCARGVEVLYRAVLELDDRA
ncbi:MAG TPA: Zn-dependent hydrolase [Vicinamibacteria bacterium]|nr:Zn-dependent hydrolase [Vicinamibacteria bacterium]